MGAMGEVRGHSVRPEVYFPLVVVLLMFGFWARATHGVGLTAIVMGAWIVLASTAGAVWTVNRWNRWWVWVLVSAVYVLLAAAGLEFISIAEEF